MGQAEPAFCTEFIIRWHRLQGVAIVAQSPEIISTLSIVTATVIKIVFIALAVIAE
jgi:hypothetical protein